MHSQLRLETNTSTSVGVARSIESLISGFNENIKSRWQRNKLVVSLLAVARRFKVSRARDSRRRFIRISSRINEHRLCGFCTVYTLLEVVVEWLIMEISKANVLAPYAVRLAIAYEKCSLDFTLD